METRYNSAYSEQMHVLKLVVYYESLSGCGDFSSDIVKYFPCPPRFVIMRFHCTQDMMYFRQITTTYLQCVFLIVVSCKYICTYIIIMQYKIFMHGDYSCNIPH